MDKGRWWILVFFVPCRSCVHCVRSDILQEAEMIVQQDKNTSLRDDSE